MPDRHDRFGDSLPEPGREPPLHYDGIGVAVEPEAILPPGTLAPGHELNETESQKLLQEQDSIIGTIATLCGGHDKFKLDKNGRITYAARPKGDTITENNARQIDELVDRLVLVVAALKERRKEKK